MCGWVYVLKERVTGILQYAEDVQPCTDTAVMLEVILKVLGFKIFLPRSNDYLY